MIYVWIEIVQRLRKRRPVLAVNPRRQVPWNALDLLVLFLLAILLQGILVGVLQKTLGTDVFGPLLSDRSNDLSKAHPLQEIFVQAGWSIRIACTLIAVIVAPLCEEMVFRVIFQGWLEKTDRILRVRFRGLTRLCRWGTLPVLISSFVFASFHFRFERTTVQGKDITLLLMLTFASFELVLLGIIVFALRLRGATWSDLGWEPRRLLGDVWLGLSTFFAIAIPLFFGHNLLTKVFQSFLPVYIAPDPIPLFFFAIVLGTLYLRTHRAVASITTHAAFNACSMGSLWLYVLHRAFQ